MALPLLANVGAMLASYLVMEGLSAVVEHYTGDPEAAVDQALQQVQQQAEFGALQDYTRESRVQDFVGQSFKGINPERSLTELALMRRGVYDQTDPDRAPVLNYVSQKLGVPPDQIIKRSSPTRMGDMTSITRSLPNNMLEQQNG